MFKRILIFIPIFLFILGISRFSFAQPHTEHKHSIVETTESVISEGPVDVGNKICPVSGEKIDEKMKATYEYEGKIYNFCCAMCIDEFKKDPQKYIKKVEGELQSESKEESKHEERGTETMQGPASHQGMH